ncbi:YslB family protein [Fructilactobacillus myrtifloralis]|uniref:YslB family protein n=1 Tax=Fructilactobacillus myrtifloralis TaxID=2940301 RepID=A0ABY5BQ63_9LACO|nr:DUF2507 domain-containing protein [Fructilactobacillus myrtifloralis]USS85193.1 YslB family protein [Fructilactobacillus myrtifloralis]
MSKQNQSDFNKYQALVPDLNGWNSFILRDELLPDLLQDDLGDILYWAGKNLALKLPVTPDDLPAFFAANQWGTLTQQTATEQKTVWNLSGPVVTTRLKMNKDCDFMLETGFLAQTQEQSRGWVSEAEAKKKLNGSIAITVVSDPNQPAPDRASQPPVTFPQPEQS